MLWMELGSEASPAHETDDSRDERERERERYIEGVLTVLRARGLSGLF
jgi:hypothetical protein